MARLDSEFERMRQVFAGRSVLVSGHTGFKGSWLTFILSILGAHVYGASNSCPDDSRHIYHSLGISNLIVNSNHETIDVTTIDYPSLIREIQPDFVFHLAAQAIVSKSYYEPEITIRTNVFGVLNLLESLRTSDFKTTSIIVTSDKCYKNNNQGLPFKESDELGGVDTYSSSKAAAEIIINSYLCSFPILSEFHGVASCRAGNVFGGGDFSENRLVPDLINNLVNFEKATIRMPQATRPWTYVLDVLFGYISLAIRLQENAKEYSESWNFATSGQVTVEEIGKILVNYLGKGEIQTEEGESIGYEATLLGLDASKAFSRLNWVPKSTIPEALRDTLQWYVEAGNGVEMSTWTKDYLLKYLKKK
jgi:CDP-glucose 4,6-dehydratase